MPQSRLKVDNYQEDDLDLTELFNSLVARRFFIAGLTGFFTVLTILYALNLTLTYRATSSFISPSEISVTTVNKLNLIKESKETIFSEFLTKLSSKELQKLAFIKGDFITAFNTDNSPIDNVDAFISGAIQSVIVYPPNLTLEDQALGFLPELSYSVVMEGNSAEAISEYLNSLVDLANSTTISEITNLHKLKTSNRLEEISKKRTLLLEQAELNRFSKIERIKEEDGQKIRQINDQIDRARYKAKENRLNQIVVLTDSIKIAKSLGIIENNFKQINDDTYSYDFTIAIVESMDLPEWYLYGEKALIQRVELLESRSNDDPFIPELITLNNQLDEIQNNSLLKTLETRQDDGPFIQEIVNLVIEEIELESKLVDMIDANAMQLSQISVPQKNLAYPNKRTIVLVAFIGSFIISILLALIMGLYNRNKKIST